MLDKSFWKNKKILITGHTGFKGSWLCLWLKMLGANVNGYALKPPTDPSLYDLCKIDEMITSYIGDIRDLDYLTEVFQKVQPEIVIHMAAQPIVMESYKNPVETYQINVMGTVNLLEAVRKFGRVKSVVNVTTDKCYENKEWYWGYRENEPMGGYDPYSNSKGCSELVTSSYRNSFFNVKDYKTHGVALASARAGNVIGGGDWASDRLIPDCVKALQNGDGILIRSPYSLRPWQHVLEPLSGYLLLAQRLYEDGPKYAEGWNFGPEDKDVKTVEWIVQKMCSLWDENASYEVSEGEHLHEAKYLKLDCSKAKNELNWIPKWNLEQAIIKIIEWSKANIAHENMRDICIKQIEEYDN